MKSELQESIDEFEIVYKMEITQLQPICLEYKREKDIHTIAIKNAENNSLHAVVILKS